jgi:hypothetical protein
LRHRRKIQNPKTQNPKTENPNSAPNIIRIREKWIVVEMIETVFRDFGFDF